MSELCTRNTNLVRSLERDSKCCECLNRDDNVITVHLLPTPSYTAHYWDLIEFLEIPTPTCYRERYNITTSNLLTPGPPCTWNKVDTRVNLRAMPQPKTAQVRIFSVCVFVPQCTDNGRKLTRYLFIMNMRAVAKNRQKDLPLILIVRIKYF
jgi:hypothetical protein